MIQKKICLLGAFGVGKTSLVSRFVHSIFSDKYLTTVGVKIEKKTVAAGQRDVDLVIWDIYGEDDFQKVRLSYLRGAAGYLLVADGTRRATLDVAWSLRANAAATVGDVPFLLLVNKADLTASWEIDEPALAELERLNWTVIRTSAKTGAGVEGAFGTLADAMLRADGLRRETTS
jgi:small GTP-binding protein